MMKKVLIKWDANHFDGEAKLLPDTKTLYTQLYGYPFENDAWSLLLESDESPRTQGYKSISRIRFVAEKAPHEVLKPGFKFPFFDGKQIVGNCIVIDENTKHIEDVWDMISVIENKKKELREFVGSIEKSNFEFSEEKIRNISLYCNDYPFLFDFIISLSPSIAIEYLKKHFLRVPMNRNSVYRSNLPFFLHQLKKSIQGQEFIAFVNELPEVVRESEIMRNALEEIE